MLLAGAQGPCLNLAPPAEPQRDTLTPQTILPLEIPGVLSRNSGSCAASLLGPERDGEAQCGKLLVLQIGLAGTGGDFTPAPFVPGSAAGFWWGFQLNRVPSKRIRGVGAGSSGQALQSSQNTSVIY